MSAVLVWYRHDLRLADHPALFHAGANSDDVLPVYILDTAHPRPMGGASRWWLHHSLSALSTALKQQGAHLALVQGEAIASLLSLVKQSPIKAVYWHEGINPYDRACDEKLKAEMAVLGVEAHCYSANLMHDPARFLNLSGQGYKVFTPFWRKCAFQIPNRRLYPIPKLKQHTRLASESLTSWDLLPIKPNWATHFPEYWQPGEAGAHQQLDQFIRSRLEDYDIGRDFPARAMTSRVSPHLHFGEISPLQIWTALDEIKTRDAGFRASLSRYRSELGWREFNHHLLFHYPDLATQNVNRKFDAFPWKLNQKQLRAWQKGLTGFPIVDAGMRELWHTGYMHNRVRMIVGSFLVKDLLIDWRLGEAWFWDTLVDADWANNAGGWQWVAGAGADAAPYFRVFNPKLQGEKFDPEGKYVAQWVPELARLPAKYIHEPSMAPAAVLATAGVVLGKTYPRPLVAHNVARDEALAAYKALT